MLAAMSSLGYPLLVSLYRPSFRVARAYLPAIFGIFASSYGERGENLVD